MNAIESKVFSSTANEFLDVVNCSARKHTTPSEDVLMNNRMIWLQGDITHLRVDAIVNAARSSLRPGGGVCGAIHRAAGPHLKKLCSQRRQLHGSCDTGKAVITDAGSLSVRKVIHAVGPVWYWGWRSHVKQAQLASVYRNSLVLAAEQGLETITFPAISTGHYRFPRQLAARIAITTVSRFLQDYDFPRQVTFVCFDKKNAEIYKYLFNEIITSKSKTDLVSVCIQHQNTDEDQ